MNIYLDIETRASSRAAVHARVTAAVKPPANYKKPETIAQWWAGEGDAAKAEAIARTALDGTWGEIICIGWAVDDGRVLVTTGGAESELIEAWAETLESYINELSATSQSWDLRATWVGHNVQDFDLRFLWQRCVVSGIKLPFRLPLERYPKGPWLYDTMKEWSGFNKFVKQTDLELAFGLARTDPLERGGADVAGADMADVVAHCTEDVRLLREIHGRMTR